MTIEIRLLGPEHADEFAHPILTAFGLPPSPERAERSRRLPEFVTRIGAYDGNAIVGSAGAFAFDFSTPGGGTVPTSGLTMVAVMPTHRRRGILRKLIERQLADARDRGQPIAALWATEATIYGRFGYGIAAFSGDVSIERDRSAFVGSPVPFEAHFVSEAEALERMPPLYERARRAAPCMPSRSPLWWSLRRLLDVESTRAGSGPLQRVIVKVDGRDEGYALYRTRLEMTAPQIPVVTVTVQEAMGASPAGTRAVWRYLCDIDLATRINATCLSPDHPLFLLLAEPRRMHYRTYDSVWVRIVDVPRALAARRYGAEGSIVIEVDDEFCPWNTGRYRLDAATSHVTRTEDPCDLRVSAAALGSAYLGGFSFSRLAEIGGVIPRTEGALERADRMFVGSRLPYCPEIF
ncbi:GNAT family N-acetyltransferase [Polyangium jinanense]|uniref:GNAT family N-acetyltransferase n=1 Tax=Polyangium jinanense TaxID=2829994 RepID=A0A9X3XCY3_9BACT|nr:GNAT family N-acetyltransferase [Polyangium jinanense]MDC3955745.1 GNAT family N-acetyltransferase [Polyangium jinanense]MDC3986698.1 GNAT family N-acetyltransferase [Polyangium jinanense]